MGDIKKALDILGSDCANSSLRADMVKVLADHLDEPVPHNYHVVAGKYERDGDVCKYSSSFATLDEAITFLDTVNDYPWSYIEYKGRVLDVFQKGYSPLEV